jgi:small-conductance mechanosensitive channel
MSLVTRVQKICLTLTLVLLWGTHTAFALSAFADEPPEAINEKILLDHLESLASWQRSVISIETTPNNSLEKLLKDALKQNSTKALQFGFEFARAQAVTFTTEKPEVMGPENPNDPKFQITKTINDLNARVAAIRAETNTVNAKINRANSRTRAPLIIKREQLNGELKLATARLELLGTVTDLFGNEKDDSDSDTLTKVNDLALTIPALNKKKTTTTPAPTDAGATTSSTTPSTITPAAEEPVISKGIVGIGSDMLALYHKTKEITDLITQTGDLRDKNQDLIDSLRDTLQASIKQGTDATNSLTSADAKAITEQRQRVDGVITNFKQISTAVLPLGQVNIWLDVSKKNLKEWRNSLNESMTRMTRSLMVQLAILGFAILIPIGFSELARRAIRKYVHDSKRERQLNIIRRTIFTIALLLIILLNFVTEFGSIATYAGLLTAGLAVALQNVILSMFAHFFYFGRFGVRVGDRVQIGKVIGEVIHVGLVRLYLMELDGPSSELYPTGKIVAFPNSILFQPSAFTKQIPGTNYSWQEITFILDPSTDYRMATKKLNEAVNIVYTQYSDIMEQQKNALTRATHLDVKMPTPKGFMNFINNGLALIIRYPIETSHASEINQRIAKKLLEAIEAEPSLKLVSSTPPKIEAVIERQEDTFTVNPEVQNEIKEED